MKKFSITGAVAKTLLTLVVTAGCTRTEPIDRMPAGTEVTVTTADGTLQPRKLAD